MQNANVNGPMTWSAANAWAENLVFAGYDDWRLPTTIQFDDPSCPDDVRGTLLFEHHVGCNGINAEGEIEGEMEHLTAFELYDAEDPPPQDGYSHLGDAFINEPFINIVSEKRYWTGTPYRDGIDPYTGDTSLNNFYWQWAFTKTYESSDNLDGPFKTTLREDALRYAWAVRSGGAPATVPLPACDFLQARRSAIGHTIRTPCPG